jgi:hypothetical protein
MQKNSKHEVLIGSDGEKFIAASLASPYFFITASTEIEVKQKVKKAFTFYHDFSDEIINSATLNKKQTLSSLSGFRKFSIDELEAA